MLARTTAPFFVFALQIILASAVSAVPQSSQEPGESKPAAAVDPKLSNLLQTAQRAQLEGEYKFAAEQWQQVWEQFPKSQYTGVARLQAGTCFQELRQFPLAIENLKAAIPLLKDKAVQIPKAQLILGYSQLELGKQLAGKQDPASKKQATDLFATSTRSFEQLLASSPNYVDAEQACFFLGDAYEKLDRKQDAINAYKRMDGIKNKKGTFNFDSLFAIADLHHQLGQYGEANQYFDRFLAESKTTGHPDRDTVNFSAAGTLVALGEAAKLSGDAAATKKYFNDAITRLKEVTNQQADGNNAQLAALIRDSKKRMAFCHRQLDQFQQAADLFADLSNSTDATDAVAMQTFAGLSYLDAKQTDKAIEYLRLATTKADKPGVEAARWLAEQQLGQQKYQEAYSVATKFIPLAQPPHLVPLKMHQAEAAIEIPEKQQESVGLFQAIVTSHPDHELTPLAMYNLAFGQVQNKQYDLATGIAKTFLEKYPKHEYTADVIEVQADALMMSKKFTDAEKTYTRLTSDQTLSSNPKRPQWVLSNANAKFQLKNFAAAIQDLEPVINLIQPSGKRADALHLLGTSYYQIEQYEKAAKNLAEAIKTDPNSKLIDDSRFFLALSQLNQNEFEKAKQTTAELAATSPTSTRLNQVYLQLGNDRYKAEQQTEAISFFQKVIDSNNASPKEKASALFGAAWANLKNDDPNAADPLFSKVIEEYPDSDLVDTAKIGRANARRLAGKGKSSIADLQSLVLKSAGKEKADLLLEIGLTQVDEKSWQNAITTFEQLVKEAPKDDRLDKFYYELAWANRSIEQEEKALQYFEKIIKETPNSDFAAESNFHLGKHYYDTKKYDDAVAVFRACMKQESAKPEIREKAAYKLAWALYKQNKFSEAHTAFQDQIDKFPTGPLVADGKFMIAESLFRNNKFGEAFQAYKVAKPVVDASSEVGENLKWLTMLHGAQAANKQKDFSAAIELAKGIEESDADQSLRQDVYLELGTAYNGIKNSEQATKYWRLAADSLSKTGARAICMIGNQLFSNKKHEEAVSQYKKVFFGFGGKQADESIRPWQAYARYEAARCNYVRVKSTEDIDAKRKLVQQAIEHFEKLIEDYPNDKLAPEAKRQIEMLKKIEI